MPLQNRVTPFGEIVAVSGRGLMMGNRGVLHDDHRHIVRYSQVRRWIACLIEFRGRHRTIMKPRSYTELFFLDEATALAAGHRPCAECRHEDYVRFKTLWEKCIGKPADADAMDHRLELDRLAGKATKRLYVADWARLPDGTFIAEDGVAWLLWGDDAYAWTADGYGRRRKRRRRGTARVITPRSIVKVLAAGYRPRVHPSVKDKPRAPRESAR